MCFDGYFNSLDNLASDSNKNNRGLHDIQQYFLRFIDTLKDRLFQPDDCAAIQQDLYHDTWPFIKSASGNFSVNSNP